MIKKGLFNMRYLGLDYGTVRIGVAISDPDAIIAQPFRTVDAKSLKKAVAEIAEICKEKDVKEIVIGLPLHMNGDEGESASAAKKLGQFINDATALKINYIDERLSTVSANKALNEGNVKGKKKRDNVDAIAAAIILQNYLDREMEFNL